LKQILNVNCVNVGFEPTMPLLAQPLSFELSEGELFVVRGENGTGKTCLLLTLAGLLVPHCGSIRVSSSSTRRILASSDLGVFPNLGVHSVMRRIRPFIKTNGNIMRVLLSWLEHHRVLTSPAKHWSGGIQRGFQCGLCIAASQSGDILLLDEPLTHLDKELGTNVMEEMISSALECGRGVIVVTHQDLGRLKANRILELSNSINGTAHIIKCAT
jgi:ATP-binding cassette, subfamily C, bacterial CydC